MITIQTLLEQSSQQLSTVSDSPRLDAELLLGYCLNKERSYFYAWGEELVNASAEQAFIKLLKKRLTNYPIAYLLGYQAFWSLDLIVNEDVLIPRPETELLVETALEKIQYLKAPKILDLGTGSGAIALAIATERADAIITATDYSYKALAVAKENAQKNHLYNVNFIHSNWFSDITIQSFDLIVANPPYIKSQDAHLQQGIRYEPLQALSSGETGLEDIKIILTSALDYMKDNAWMLIEHGYDQGELVPKLMTKIGGLQDSHCIKDYNKNDRLSMAKKEVTPKNIRLT